MRDNWTYRSTPGTQISSVPAEYRDILVYWDWTQIPIPVFWYSTLDNVFKDAYWFLANFRKQKLEIFCLKQEKRRTNLIWQKTGQMLKIIFTNSSSQNAFKLVNIFNQRKKTSPTLFGPDMHCGSNGPREKGKSPQ